MLVSGIYSITSGVLTGTVPFALTLGSAPNLVLAVVQNTSNDETKFQIGVWVSGITSNGFSFNLDSAPNNGNYSIVYLAGDPGLFSAVGTVGIPESALPAIQSKINAYKSPHLTEWDVRQYINDHAVQKNNRNAADLDYSPGQIAFAMESAAREFNGLIPYSYSVKAKALPKDDNLFLDATAYFLYLGSLQEEQRHSVAYTAGSVQVSVSQELIKNYSTATQMLYARFQQTAVSRKKIANLRQGYRRIG